MELILNSITKTYNGKTVLDDFSLTLTPGVYGLLGPNGAGKTTLISIITGLVKQTSGNISFVGNNNESIVDTLGYLPQNQDFYKNFSGKELLLYMLELKEYRPENYEVYVEKLLSDVNLIEHKNKKIGKYSGGMKQRLGIAQALIGDPSIVIFDEPTAGLDPKERIRFRNIISSLGSNKIILFATHIVTDIDFIAKEVILLNQGKLIKSAPQIEITQAISGSVWEYNCDADIVIDIMAQHKISNVRVNNTDCTVRIISDKKPYDTAYNCIPNLEDVCIYYFGDL